jgi:hypothetical protein
MLDMKKRKIESVVVYLLVRMPEAENATAVEARNERTMTERNMFVKLLNCDQTEAATTIIILQKRCVRIR